MKMYPYKAYHLLSGNVFERTLEQGSVHEGIIVLGYNQVSELMNRWNYIATLQPTLQWMYVAMPDTPIKYLV